MRLVVRGLRVAPVFAALLFLRCSSATTSTQVTDPDAAAPDSGIPGTDEAGEPTSCPTTGAVTTPGNVATPAATEISGIVASAHNAGTYWMHNDSGDTARAFAVSDKGVLQTTLSFDTVMPTDIEDMTIEEESADKSYLYFADIGDNNAVRKELTIHRVVEPKLDGTATLTVTSEKMRFVYPDGAHNAESIMFDSVSKELLVATKKVGGPSEIHRVGKFVADTKVTTEKLVEVAVDFATGGDISRDGRFLVLRNPSAEAMLWSRASGESWTDALARKPCKLPIAKEPQGEAFAFLPDGKAYVTISEGASPALHLTPFQ
ncbi:MAG: hypothetical protein JWM74_5520 [Myxococcaceae bacterium]|nr:hypothetical protein [Myxococcaceae bacterium]